ncbi:MAG: hypothetical protein JO002_08745 [Burkholderiaceae bacterium]|nr:hypothetical protein [Burkholderiaceae bacterium]
MIFHGKPVLELEPNAARQYINARATFTAYEQAVAEAAQVRGGMHWKKRHDDPGTEYLVRTQADLKRSEHSLGRRSEETERIYGDFTARKTAAMSRLAELKRAVIEQERLNKALFVGQVPPIVIDILNRLGQAGLGEHFRVVGTHALYAYEAAGGCHFTQEAVATQDIDLLWDIRRRVSFATALARVDVSMLGVLRQVDKSFTLRSDQRYTAVNSKGFEVDILRREHIEDDPHPVKLSENEDDFWVVEAPRAKELADAPPFSAIVVGTNGKMARMNTIAPAAFIHFKRWMSELAGRENLKRKRDALQADAVEYVLRENLPQLTQIFEDT